VEEEEEEEEDRRFLHVHLHLQNGEAPRGELFGRLFSVA